MTSTRLLLTAGSVAATLAGIVPVISSSPAAAQSPLRVNATGVAVSVAPMCGGADATAMMVVPEGITSLAGAASGSPALAARTRLVVMRTADGATLFTGSLATFRSLPVVAGASLRVSVVKPAGFGGLRAGALLRWS